MDGSDLLAPLWVVQGGLIVAAVALLAELWARRAWLRSPGDLAVVGLVGTAAGLARWAAPWAAFSQEFRPAAMFYAHGWFTRYGFGMAALERCATDLLRLPATWTTLFGLGFVAGVLAPVVLVAWLRDVGLSRTAALAGGLVLALDPGHVRFSPTEGPNVPEVALATLALLLATRHARTPSLLVGTAAGAVLGTAAEFRPDGLLLVPLVPLLAVAATGGRPWRHRGTLGGVLALALTVTPQLVLVALHLRRGADDHLGGGFFVDGHPNHALLRHGWRHLVWLDPAWTAPVVAVAVAMGVLVGERRRLAGTVLAVALLLTLAVPGADWSPAGAVTFTFVRHQLRAAVFVAAGAALGVDAAAARFGAAAGAVLAAGLALGRLAWLPLAYVPSTMQAEMVFFVDHLDAIPQRCTFVVAEQPGDGPFKPTSYVSVLRPDVTIARLGVDPIPEGGCVAWYRSAACAWEEDPDLGARCRTFEEDHVHVPIAEGAVPNGPWIGDHYREDPVRVGLYQVVPRSPPAASRSEGGGG